MLEPRALLFDVDGTLYSQHRLRARLLPRLIWAALRRPERAREMGRALDANRRALEQLRNGPLPGPVPQCQLELAARLSGVEAARVEAYVKEWFGEMPLPLLKRCARPGLWKLLELARKRGIALGVLSDYPAEAKLRALGVREYFSVVLNAADARVQAYKPSPRGLLVALETLHVEPASALYVGDRPDVDAVAAARAGLGAVIVGSAGRRGAGPWLAVSDFAELGRHLGDGR